jgi:predicted secreted Zn-dependent protease
LHELLNPAEKNAVIKVSGTVYPGVTVSLFHNDYTFSTEARHCKIWLDQEQKIQVSPL